MLKESEKELKYIINNDWTFEDLKKNNLIKYLPIISEIEEKELELNIENLKLFDYLININNNNLINFINKKNIEKINHYLKKNNNKYNLIKYIIDFINMFEKISEKNDFIFEFYVKYIYILEKNNVYNQGVNVNMLTISEIVEYIKENNIDLSDFRTIYALIGLELNSISLKKENINILKVLYDILPNFVMFKVLIPKYFRIFEVFRDRIGRDLTEKDIKLLIKEMKRVTKNFYSMDDNIYISKINYLNCFDSIEELEEYKKKYDYTFLDYLNFKLKFLFIKD